MKVSSAQATHQVGLLSGNTLQYSVIIRIKLSVSPVKKILLALVAQLLD